MTSPVVERRLAAILAADVVGYSRLVGIDEEGTIARLARLREEVIDPITAKYGGRLFKTTGDGIFIEFASIVDAMRCATEIQRQLAVAADEPPGRDGMTFRVGVNLGDIVVEGEDILGDGVNIAARLEGLAEPGGICVPGKVYQEVHNKLDVGFEYAGEQTVKNIEAPITTYRVLLDPGMAGKTLQAGKRNPLPRATIALAAVIILAIAGVLAWQQPWKESVGPTEAAIATPVERSIAVLPFQNMSGDASQAYFADGIAEDIITDLSKISDLFVIASNTSFQYREPSLDLGNVSRELGVRYILEGSVRHAGDRVRINAQLVDARTGGQIWAERYDGDLADVFAAQDQVTASIIDALKLTLTPDERKAVETRATDNAEAYDAYLRGLELLAERRRYDHDANAEALEAFEQAVAIDPQYALALAGLAWGKYLRTTTIHQDLGAEAIFEMARKSVELDDNALARRVLAREHFSLLGFDWVITDKDVDLARRQLERAHELQPNDPDVLVDLAIVLVFTGEPERALEMVERARELNPNQPDWYFAASGIARLVTGDADGAVRDLSRWSLADPNFPRPHLFLAAAQANAGRQEAAKASLAQYHDLYILGLRSIAAIRSRWPMAPEHLEILIEGLRKAGMDEGR